MALRKNLILRRPRRGCLEGCIASIPAPSRRPTAMNDINPPPARPLPHSSHWGAFSVRVRDRDIEIVPHPRDAAPSALLGNIPASVSHRRGSPGRWCGAAGWSGARGPTARRGRDEFVPLSLAGGARPRRRRIAPGLCRARAARGVRRLLWLGQRRALSRRAAPAPPLPEPRRRLCPLGQQLQLGRGDGDPAARHRPAGLGRRQQCQLGRAGRGERAGAGLWRHGAEEQRCRRRRHEPAHRPRPSRRGAPARRRISPDRPAARRPAGRGRGGLAPDPSRHRCRADARPGAYPGRRRDCTTAPSSTGSASAGRNSRPICSGSSDGQPKDAAWAAAICGIPADEIVGLARRCAGRRTLVTCSMSLQRAEHGEQPVWMGVVLAAMLGQIGLPGGGFAYALGATSNTGKPPLAVPLPTMPTGRNSIADFIPVARIADMLLQPGRGVRLQRPASRLSRYQAGLLGRRQPVPPPSGSEPAAPRLRPAGYGDRAGFGVDGERAPCRHRAAGDDHAGARGYRRRGRRPAAGGDAPRGRALPRGARRSRDLAPASPSGSASPRRSPRAARPASGSNSIYEPTRRALAERGVNAPDFDAILGGRRAGPADPAVGRRPRSAPSAAIPTAAPLPTPSGRIEIASATIAGFGYADCPGHPAWLPPVDGAGSPAAARFPLQLDRQPAGDPAAQPIGFRRHQPCREDPRARAGAHPSAGRRRRAASKTATSCGSTTSAAPASPGRC